MTIVAIFHRKADNDLYAFADSRLTTPSGSVLTDSAPKFFTLNVTLHQSRKPGVSRAGSSYFPPKKYELGIGYAGSATVAFATIATLQAYLSQLIVPHASPSPTVKDIADLGARLLESNFRSFGQIWPKSSSRCEFVIFGGRPDDKALSAYYLTSDVVGEQVVTVVNELPLVSTQQCRFFGSAEGFIQERLTKYLADRPTLDPIGFLDEILTSNERSDIGGSVQVAIAKPGQVWLPVVLEPNWENEKYRPRPTFLGRERMFGQVGQAYPGLYAVRSEGQDLKPIPRRSQ